MRLVVFFPDFNTIWLGFIYFCQKVLDKYVIRVYNIVNDIYIHSENCSAYVRKGGLCMKKVFSVSLCREGILGGGMFVEPEKLTYRTGKLTVSPRLRNLEMPVCDIANVSRGRMLFLPTFTLKMKNDEEFKFIVFAGNSFLKTLKELGINL